jgi:MinD superfamily P-loop ATPase
MNKEISKTTIVVLSGKGGTGKTTISNILIEKLQSKVFIDCDVDAPNLHLVQKTNVKPIERGFVGLPKYKILQNQCIHCGICYSLCAYQAIDKKNITYTIDPYRCEGCSLCYVKCPANAIKEIEQIDGHTYIYKEEDKLFGTAQTNIGAGNSGKLVTEIRNQIRDENRKTEFEIIDGPPGIGCPVIASITNTNYALLVTEPSLSGLSDLKRIIQTALILKTIPVVIINRADLNIKLSTVIEKYLKDNDIIYLGNLPYDKNIIQKNNLEQYDEESIFFKKMNEIIKKLIELINKEKEI